MGVFLDITCTCRYTIMISRVHGKFGEYMYVFRFDIVIGYAREMTQSMLQNVTVMLEQTLVK